MTIPKRIYQTWKTKILDAKMQQAVDTWKNLNPEFEHFLYDDQDCIDFIAREYSMKHLRTYLALKPAAFKADFWRYLILYKYGGVYVDIDCVAHIPIRNVIGTRFTFVSVAERRAVPGIFNAFLACEPKQLLFKNIINKIIVHVNLNHYPEQHISDPWTHILDITGPVALANSYNFINGNKKYTKLHSGIYGSTRFLHYDKQWVYADEKVFMATKYEGYPISAMDYKMLFDTRNVYTEAKTWYLWNFKPDEQNLPPTRWIDANQELSPYDNFIAIPENIRLIVEKHTELAELWDKIPKWVVKADIARLLLVYHYGGMYLDSDVHVRTKLIPHRVTLFTEIKQANPNRLGPRENREYLHRLANYAFGALNAYDPFFKAAIKLATERVGKLLEESKDWSDSDILWVAGPDVITTTYHSNIVDNQNIYIYDNMALRHYEKGSWRSSFTQVSSAQVGPTSLDTRMSIR